MCRNLFLQEGDAQFIIPEGAGRHRGRLELSFSQIGGSIFAGILEILNLLLGN
jgi:hypothetical protein